ncbi:uracil-DNA glycosylase [Halobacillus sp. ACCC02827]|uniref:uracil-DNA glycosylase n=1 Tax=Bacillaceae TaxID=186817 RepID=UPI0003F66710|nr:MULTISPECIES: uracil-DNA glycosylase [Bacillaceae]QHT46808.1 uracil-DNA glycosylase [Bacillus sp. SB49]WJE14029.1 uracil-DNA glycosylase [Halobacillus sp. ACCC02827]
MLNNDWNELLEEEKEKDYFLQLKQKLNEEYKEHRVYPAKSEILNALAFTPREATKVVILGQDPYHGKGQAHGFSFSVRPDVTIPPSLRNIYKELHHDLDIPAPNHGCLLHWAEQGVLLLNDVLTVREKQPNSHKGIGWERFTDAVIEILNQRERPVVFLLWGKHAQKKGASIDTEKHMVIASPHPSPFAAHRGFFGSKPFSRVNEFLKKHGEEPIDWKLPADCPDA